MARVEIDLSSSTTMAEELAAIEGALANTEEPKAKRQKLKPYDLLPAQMLNAMGASGVETIGLDKLAAVQAKGNKAAPYFTELCDELPSRKGIAVSRMSEVQLKAGAKLSAPVYKKPMSDSIQGKREMMTQ